MKNLFAINIFYYTVLPLYRFDLSIPFLFFISLLIIVLIVWCLLLFYCYIWFSNHCSTWVFGLNPFYSCWTWAHLFRFGLNYQNISSFESQFCHIDWLAYFLLVNDHQCGQILTNTILFWPWGEIFMTTLFFYCHMRC